MSAQAVYRSFATPPPGTDHIEVTLSRKPWAGVDRPGNARIALFVDGESSPRAVGEATLHSLEAVTIDLPVPASPFRIDFAISPTFSPAEFGERDERQLGAVLGVRFVPRTR
jgi:hypothetical protein